MFVKNLGWQLSTCNLWHCSSITDLRFRVGTSWVSTLWWDSVDGLQVIQVPGAILWSYCFYCRPKICRSTVGETSFLQLTWLMFMQIFWLNNKFWLFQVGLLCSNQSWWSNKAISSILLESGQTLLQCGQARIDLGRSHTSIRSTPAWIRTGLNLYLN